MTPLPEPFVSEVAQVLAQVFPDRTYDFVPYLAQLLWQRGWRDRHHLPGWFHPQHYTPTSPFAFGDDMDQAVERLSHAYDHGEKVAIWGDFDADGLTATAVLWDGLGQFFSQPQLSYVIPNRLTESHGLHKAGLTALAEQGCTLVVTCDTGSTHLDELAYAKTLGLDVIVTDHHTLPTTRPEVVALINPRTLPPDHPLAHLSGVAVAYKLVEALYVTLPDVPQRPLSDVLDLVAIGLITDLVELRGDCRYLAQRGIQQLQQLTQDNAPRRPGIARLLQLCRRTGDRPMDISFGLGPRINAISRIHGDATFAVELLTSSDGDRCQQLALETELANSRRKALQRQVIDEVTLRLAEVDLSTTQVIVLADAQWSVGVLGLVAGHIAQTYHRPTILLSTAMPDAEASALSAPPTLNEENPTPSPPQPQFARGSARSVQSINLYDLVQRHSHLLHRFGGHPFAAGLSLAVENIEVFRESINRECREQYGDLCRDRPPTPVDLTVTVAELGPSLFQTLKLLEPCGMGNPVPRLLIQSGQFSAVFHRNIKDVKGGKLRYIYTRFTLSDRSCAPGFPGIWWGHYADELPEGPCDVVVELDFNSVERRYEVRLLELRVATAPQTDTASPPEAPEPILLDWRSLNPTVDSPSQTSLETSPETPPDTPPDRPLDRPLKTLVEAPSGAPPGAPSKTASKTASEAIAVLEQCPHTWHELEQWVRASIAQHPSVAIAFSPPPLLPPETLWRQLVGVAKYLSRTGTSISASALSQRLGISDRVLEWGLAALTAVGFQVERQPGPVAPDSTNADPGSLAASQPADIRITLTTNEVNETNETNESSTGGELPDSIHHFLAAIQEEQFQQQYFATAPIDTLAEELNA